MKKNKFDISFYNNYDQNILKLSPNYVYHTVLILIDINPSTQRRNSCIKHPVHRILTLPWPASYPPLCLSGCWRYSWLFAFQRNPLASPLKSGKNLAFAFSHLFQWWCPANQILMAQTTLFNE